MKVITQKRWDELVNLIKFLYQGQKLMADQINVLTNQVAALNAKVLPNAEPSGSPVVHDNEAHVDRILGSGQDGSPNLPS